jgi:phage terminase large subunit GpA-like protein
MYASASDIRRNVAEAIRPPERLTVSEGIARTLVTATGPYQPNLTPYMAQPADSLASRRYRTVVFIGPARCGKTVTLIDGWIARNVRYEPGDMLVVQASQDLARYYSKVRIKRMIDASPEVSSRLSLRRQDDNTYDKVFRNGMVLAFGWPSGAQLSGRDFRYVAITEYDAADDDIEGEGSLYALGSKRTETYMSAGTTLVETSIRREYRDANWRAKTPHEAPPATGATSLYNMGTRHWLYWPCPHCGEFFPLHPDVHVMFRLPALKDLAEQLAGADPDQWARENAIIGCPRCGGEIEERQKRALNLAGRWVPDGCTIDSAGVIHGDVRETEIDSYQLSCVAAAYASWRRILKTYAVAISEYIRTGDETEIKSTVNLDQGRAYLPLSAQRGERSPHDLQARAEEWEMGLVPAGVRFLVGSVDIQDNRFVCQIEGFGEGLQRWIVDRFTLRHSDREGPDGDRLTLSPHTHIEDWNRLIPKVIQRRYRLADGSGRSLPVLWTCIDSGGKEGVTQKAYEFWRSLRQQGLHSRVRLIKGVDPAEGPTAPKIRISYPDNTKRKDRNSGARGDVPLVLVNTTLFKDAIAAALQRPDDGPGCFHFPANLPTSWYAELTAESRNDRRWECAKGVRNEAFDLAVYNSVACALIKADKIDWTKPPGWAQDWPRNTEIAADHDESTPPPVAPPPRRKLRKASSSYLSR